MCQKLHISECHGGIFPDNIHASGLVCPVWRNRLRTPEGHRQSGERRRATDLGEICGPVANNAVAPVALHLAQNRASRI